MNIKTRLIKSSVAILMLLVITKISFAQQPITSQKTETVIYKLQKSDYDNNGTALQKSLAKINGVTINKFCSLNNKVFLILEVNRIIQPADGDITNAINTNHIGYKKVDSDLDPILNSCR